MLLQPASLAVLFILLVYVVYAGRRVFVDDDGATAAPFSALSYDRYYDDVDAKKTPAGRRQKRAVKVMSTATVFAKRELPEKDRLHMVLSPPTVEWQRYTARTTLHLNKQEEEPLSVPFFNSSFRKRFDNTATAVREVEFGDADSMQSLYRGVSYFVTGSDKYYVAVKNAILLWFSAKHMHLEDKDLNAILHQRHMVYAALPQVFCATVYIVNSSGSKTGSPPTWQVHVQSDGSGDATWRQSFAAEPTMVLHYSAAKSHTAIVDVLMAPPHRQLPSPSDWLAPDALKVAKSRMMGVFKIIEQSFDAPSGTSAFYFLRPPTAEWQMKVCRTHSLRYVADPKLPAGLTSAANSNTTIPHVVFHSNAEPRITTVDVDRKGNCGFESLSMFLSGTKKNHPLVRKILLNEIHQNYGDYLLQSVKERNAYVKKMRQLGKWMSIREMRAAAVVFQAHVLALCVKPTNVFWLYFSPERHIEPNVVPRPDPADSFPTIALLLNNNHFMPILDVSDAQTGAPFLPPPSFPQPQQQNTGSDLSSTKSSHTSADYVNDDNNALVALFGGFFKRGGK